MSEALPFRCDACTAPAVAVAPGSEPVHELFLLQRETPRRCWCLSHWREAFAHREAA